MIQWKEINYNDGVLLLGYWPENDAGERLYAVFAGEVSLYHITHEDNMLNNETIQLLEDRC